MPGDSGVLVVTRVRSITTIAHETAGAAGTRHSPRPPWGRKINARLGRIAPRDHEVMFGTGADTVIPGRCEASNPESRDSPMRNCASEVWSCGPSRNDGIWIARHCERSEAIHLAAQRKNGLLRFARNDGSTTETSWLFEN